MRKIFIYLCCISFLLFMPDIVLASQDSLSQEVQELRALINEMKNDYETKINKMQDKITKLSEQKFIEEENAELEKELESLFNDKDEQVDFDDPPNSNKLLPCCGKCQCLLARKTYFRSLILGIR